MNMKSMSKSTAAPIPVAKESAGFRIYHFSYLLVGSPICIIVSLIETISYRTHEPCELNPNHAYWQINQPQSSEAASNRVDGVI